MATFCKTSKSDLVSNLVSSMLFSPVDFVLINAFIDLLRLPVYLMQSCHTLRVEMSGCESGFSGSMN